MELDITGKCVLVTGGASRLGSVICRELAAEGCAVGICDADADAAHALVAEITAAGGTAVAAIGTIASAPEAERMHVIVRDALGDIDMLVNCIGHDLTPATMAEPDAFEAQYRAQVMPLGQIIHQLVPDMRKAGWGRIVTVASAEAMTPQRAIPLSVSAASAAILNMSLGLSKALGEDGITVNCISPGLLDLGGDAAGDAVLRAEERARQSLPGAGDPRSVASLVAWLCSPLACYVTGANIRVDGGYSPAVH